MDDNRFRSLVDESLESIPREFKNKLDNVVVLIQDVPTNQQMAKVFKIGQKGLLFGLYEGIPQTKRGRYGIGGTLPDKITLFKYPILSVVRNIDELKQKIKETVMHEIAHHFGMDEKSVRKAMKRG